MQVPASFNYREKYQKHLNSTPWFYLAKACLQNVLILDTSFL